MFKRTILASLLVAALVLPAVNVAGQGNGVHYQLIVTCPDGAAALNVAGGCPVRAVDEDDMMGDPALAVDPDVPSNLILASLHNSGDSGGPTVKSRCCFQPFTTFTSDDSGAFWRDNPFPAPDDLRGAFGEHPAITIDPFGRVYVGSLYAVPHGEDEERFNYVIAAQKFSGLQDINQNQDGEYHVEYVTPVFAGNEINQMWFLFNPATDHMSMVWHESVTPFSTTEIPGVGGNAVDASARTSTQTLGRDASRDLLDAADGLLGIAERDAARAAANETEGPFSTIGVVWSASELADPYHYQSRERAIRPCESATNPVLSEGYLYVGCIVDTEEGIFRWDPTILDGTLAIFRMHPDGGEPQYLGRTPVQGGAPKLGVRSDGRLALASTTASDDGQLGLVVAFGSYAGDSGLVEWGPLQSFGDKIQDLRPGIRIIDANIQDVIYREYSGVIHMILKQVVAYEGIGINTIAAVAAPRIQKSIVAIDETHGLLATIEVDIGNILNRTDPTLLQAEEMIYNDLSDDFLQLPEGMHQFNGRELGPHYQREFFAIGDYGTVIFAELIEDTILRGPAFAPPPAQAIPLAAPAASTTLAQVLVPAAGITITALMAAAFVVNRRKDVATAYAKSKK